MSIKLIETVREIIRQQEGRERHGRETGEEKDRGREGGTDRGTDKGNERGTWKEHMRVSSTLIIAPALSNSPQ